jgi:hypothetical protein
MLRKTEYGVCRVLILSVPLFPSDCADVDYHCREQKKYQETVAFLQRREPILRQVGISTAPADNFLVKISLSFARGNLPQLSKIMMPSPKHPTASSQSAFTLTVTPYVVQRRNQQRIRFK